MGSVRCILAQVAVRDGWFCVCWAVPTALLVFSVFDFGEVLACMSSMNMGVSLAEAPLNKMSSMDESSVRVIVPPPHFFARGFSRGYVGLFFLSSA